MASAARRTFEKVNSSAMIARHPDVPNLIFVIRRIIPQDDRQNYRLCDMRIDGASGNHRANRRDWETCRVRESAAGDTVVLRLGAKAHVVGRSAAADQDHARAIRSIGGTDQSVTQLQSTGNCGRDDRRCISKLCGLDGYSRRRLAANYANAANAFSKSAITSST